MGSTATVRLNSLLVSRSGFRGGRPCLRGTGITVHAVAAAHLLGLTAEEICLQNSDLDPSLFHAALAYYLANREQIESDLERDSAEGELLAAKRSGGKTANSFARP